MIRRPPRSTPLYSSAASDVYKRQLPPHHLLLQQNPEWFILLVPAYLGCPGKRSLNVCCCCCCCCCCCNLTQLLSLLNFRDTVVEKTRVDVVEKVGGSSSGSLGKDNESDVLRNERAENVADICEELGGTILETSFKHLWSDYSADWKDTRRYHTDGPATAPHRKLCTFFIVLLSHVL